MSGLPGCSNRKVLFIFGTRGQAALKRRKVYAKWRQTLRATVHRNVIATGGSGGMLRGGSTKIAFQNYAWQRNPDTTVPVVTETVKRQLSLGVYQRAQHPPTLRIHSTGEQNWYNGSNWRD